MSGAAGQPPGLDQGAGGRAPTLSVTVTNFNYAEYLEQNLTSILRQTFDDFELIVIDNASTDDSLEVIEDCTANDDRVRVVAHEQNQGAQPSFIESCRLARGRYRVHVDADDWIEAPDAFERQVAQLDAHPDMTFTYSTMTTVGLDGERYSHRFYDGDRVMSGVEAVPTVLGLSLGHSGLMHRLDAYEQAGGYPTGFRFYDDVMLAVRLCRLGSVGYLDEVLYAGREHGANENLEADIEAVEQEWRTMIATVFDGPLGAQIPDAARCRRRLERKSLTHLAVGHAFRDRPGLAWKLYWQSLRRHPVDTVLQRATPALVVRTLAGEAGYRRLDRLRERLGRARRSA